MMGSQIFEVREIRFHVLEKDTLWFQGFFRTDLGGDECFYAKMRERCVNVNIHAMSRAQMHRMRISMRRDKTTEVIGTIPLPDGWRKSGDLKVYWDKMPSKPLLRLSHRALELMAGEVCGRMESGHIEGNHVVIVGWLAATDDLQITVLGNQGELPVHIKRYFRADALGLYPELSGKTEMGIELTVEDASLENFDIIADDAGRREIFHIGVDDIREGRGLGLTRTPWERFCYYYAKNGLGATWKRIGRHFYHGKGSGQEDASYRMFREAYGPKEEICRLQRQEVFAYRPKISIVVPMYRTNETYLRELISSVQRQTYENWELCLADGSETDVLKNVVHRAGMRDERIRYRFLNGNKGIAGNTNEAISMAQGEYVALADHDDLLEVTALYECVKALNNCRDIDVLYSDEDKVDMNSRDYFEPHFKPDFNIDLLRSVNYICHLFVFRRDMLAEVGGFREEYDGAQDYDFILRCVERARHIYHIPMVLYHWRCHRKSTAMNPESKMYAFENGRKAVEAHYQRMGIPATVEMGENYGLYRTRYHWEEEPLISIIIPNKDHVEDLKKCVEGIEERSTYRNFEFIIVENNSVESRTFAYYDEIGKRDHVKVVYYQEEFNYSKINNVGAAHANGDYLLLLNNDTEIINEDCLKEMVDVCMRSDVGIVGARLYYADDTIQHAGVIIGIGGIAAHAFVGFVRGEFGYFGRIVCMQDLSAVTAACLMVKKQVFEQVGGLEESLKVAFNDVDFCLKVRQAGYLVVYQPEARMYHYESRSRGLEDTSQKVMRFNGEVERMQERWGDFLEKGDPYYNPNLTLEATDYSLRL